MSSSPLPTHLNFITGNKNKLAEVQAILSGVIELRSQNVDIVEIQGTVEEVTRDKARRAAEAVSDNSREENFSCCHENSKKLTIRVTIGPRPCPSRRHMSLLQSHERSSRTIHVRFLSPDLLSTTLSSQKIIHHSNTPNPSVNGS